MTTLITRANQLTTRANQPKASRKQLKQALEAFTASLPISLIAKAPALSNALDLAKRLIETSPLALRYVRDLLAKLAAYALKQASPATSPAAELATLIN